MQTITMTPTQTAVFRDYYHADHHTMLAGFVGHMAQVADTYSVAIELRTADGELVCNVSPEGGENAGRIAQVYEFDAAGDPVWFVDADGHEYDYR